MHESGGYRIIDEGSTTVSTRKAPWNPLALFFMTILFAPVGAPLFALNWPRLGRPERRNLWLILAVGVALAPFLVVALAPLAGVSFDRSTLRTIARLPMFLFAYWSLTEQRPLFDAAQSRDEGKANPWPYWILSIILSLGFLGLSMLASGARQSTP